MNDNVEYCKRVVDGIESAYNDADSEKFIEWLQDSVLDARLITDCEHNIIDVRLYVTLGGPTVWIDTESCAVKLAWGMERAEYGLNWDVCESIRDLYREYY